ncbi:hypothetical protein WG66_011421 [Moniliophthora roreri]|nr:hypothetical protein WG66_011421 [Moniliophthora roreri]
MYTMLPSSLHANLLVSSMIMTTRTYASLHQRKETVSPSSVLEYHTFPIHYSQHYRRNPNQQRTFSSLST